MKRIIYVLLLISCNLALAQAPIENLEGVDEEIQNILDDYKAVGLSIAIVKNDSIIYSKGFGFRDYDKKLPVTEKTLFGIGSNTKSFTSALIGILDKEGKIEIDKKPSEYIPHLEFSTDELNDLVTVKDLLSHRSGLGGLDGSYILFPATNRLDLMDRLPYLKQNAEPKDSWAYSNFGYIILGVIAEQVSKESWDNLIEEKLFKPLNMNSSNTSIEEMKQHSNFSYPYGIYKDKIERLLFQIPVNDKPGAAINSSANDMAKWMKMWLNYGEYNGKIILSEDFAKNAMSTKAIINGNPPTEPEQTDYLFGYGYGWHTGIYNGHFKVYHAGGVSGFGSIVTLFPAEKLGIVVMANQQNSALPYNVANMISMRMLGLNQNEPYKYEMERYDIAKPKDINPINERFKPTHSLNSYCGEYTNKGYGTIKVVQEENDLYVIFPAFKFALEHKKYDSFESKLVSEIPQQMNPEFDFKFNQNFNGEIKELVMDIQGGVVFEKRK